MKIENISGFDFFSQLQDNVESKLESNIDLSGWFEGYSSPEPIANQTQKQVETSNSDIHFYLILISIMLFTVLFVYLKGRKRK